MRLFATIIAALLLVVVAPAAAQAELRSGHVDDPQDPSAPTLGNRHDDISFVSASLDTDSGTLTVSARFYGTPSDPDANRSFPPLDFSVGKECNEAMPLDGSFSADAYWDSGEPGNGQYVVDGDGQVRLDGFQGAMHAQPALSDDHQTISVSFQNDAFKNQDWRCVSGQLDPAAQGSDQFRFYFDGWAPATLTPAIAAAQMRQALTARFGKGFGTAHPRFLACPQQQFTTSNELPAAICAAEFRAGRTWRYLEGSVVADGPRLVTTIGRVRRWVRSWRACPKTALRKARLTGALASNARDCATAAPAQVAATAKRGKLRRRMTIASATVNRAGFATVSTYRCKIARRGRTVTATCTNKLGDAFRYTFALNRL